MSGLRGLAVTNRPRMPQAVPQVEPFWIEAVARALDRGMVDVVVERRARPWEAETKSGGVLPRQGLGMRSMTKSSMRIVFANHPRSLVSTRTSSAPCSQGALMGEVPEGKSKERVGRLTSSTW